MGSASSTMSASPALDPPGKQDPSSLTFSVNDVMSSVTTSSSGSKTNDGQASDVAALRAAALRSKRGGSTPRASSPVPVREPAILSTASSSPSSKQSAPSLLKAGPPKTHSLDARITRMLPSKAIGANAVGEKEEGEISEDDEEPVERHAGECRASRSRAWSGKRKSKSRSHSPTKRRSFSKPSVPHPEQHPLPLDQPPGPARKSSDESRPDDTAKLMSVKVADSVASAPSEISLSEARDYMEIIRNLIHEGVSPDTLVQKGATPKYVMAVCEEIVQGTKKRKALWLETREWQVDSEPPVEEGSGPVDVERKSPSPDVAISVSTAVETGRKLSTSSEDSAELTLVERMSPPKNSSLRLQPSSSWTPPSPSFPTARQSAAYSQAIRIESYKPGPKVNAHLQETPDIVPEPSIVPSAATASHPTGPPSSIQMLSGPSRLPQDKQSSVQDGEVFQPRRKKRSGARDLDNGLSANADVVLNYEDETAAPSQPSTRSVPERRRPPPPIFDSPPDPPATSFPPSEPTVMLPPQTALNSTRTELEAALANALLETRRKALESMRRRRAAQESTTGLATQAENPQTAPTLEVIGPTIEEVELEKTIEEQMAELERDMLNSYPQPVTTRADDDMDIDEPEEGEITAPSPPIVISAQATSISIPDSLPSHNRPRGKKRALAEDLMETRAVTAPPRTLPPRRRPFWAMQRPQKLILHLDDSSDSSEDEGENTTSSDTPLLDPSFSASQAQLDENIRSLQERIAKLKAKKAKQEMKHHDTSERSASITPSLSDNSHLEQYKPVGTVRHDSTMSADVRQLTKELVEVEAQAEAMAARADPIVDEPIIVDNEPDVSRVEFTATEVRPRSVSPSVIQTTGTMSEAIASPLPPRSDVRLQDMFYH
ncbi:hypothetical protein IAR55_006141 [Kwoniella newhampshirensis]|uniref:Uncharacterized protein n=1 Tax=Kwoniella newhampshirensis TaxID=1651941 RepID=A0AAW0YS22_9TREE